MDPVVQRVIKLFVDRSVVGQKKYGTTLEDNNLPLQAWIQHAQEELMDGILYLERMKTTLFLQPSKTDFVVPQVTDSTQSK